MQKSGPLVRSSSWWATLELDQAGNIISYEEYHPYGSTAFHTADGNAEVSSKRYRYTGKEKDDETGPYYHGARYYAPWLGRWSAADPAGMADGLNLYRYSRDNPIVFADPGGTESKKPFAPVGSADWQIGTRTDAQLFRFLKAMTPEQRGALRGSSTGAFQARVDAFNQKYKMGTVVTLPEVTIEGSPPEPEEIPLAESPGLAHLQSMTPGFRNSAALGLRNLTGTVMLGTYGTAAVAGGGVLLAEAAPVVAASAETASLAVATSPRLIAAGEFVVNALAAEGTPTITAGIAAVGGAALRGPGGEVLEEFGDDAARVLKNAGDEILDMAPKVPLLPPSRGSSLVENALEPHEAAFAKEILEHRGGTIVGAETTGFPGIDGTIDGVAMSLKETQGGLGAVLRRASNAEAQAAKAGYSGVELFIRAPNVQVEQLLDFARSGPLSAIPNQGTIAAINVQTSNGWVRIIGGPL